MPARYRLTALFVALCAGQVLAQCPRPLTYEIGGRPGSVCSGGSFCQAVARGRHIEIESTPSSGPPSTIGRVTLDRVVVHLHTEISARICATDGYSVYAISTENLSHTPSIVGRVGIVDPETGYFARITRVRARGNFIYAISPERMYVIDATNTSSLFVRATFSPANAWLNDVELVGSYAYAAITDASPSGSALMVIDVTNPQQPVEVRRVAAAAREGYRVSHAPNLPNLYLLSGGGATAAIESWNLSNPANPVVTGRNETLNPSNVGFADELFASNGVICLMDSNNFMQSDSLRLFNTSTLAEVVTPINLPGTLTGITLEPPYCYVANQAGQLSRVQVSTPTTPTVIANYFDSPPGSTGAITNIGNGYSILTGDRDFWVFRNQPGAAPASIFRLGADPGYSFTGAPIAMLDDGIIFFRESSSTNSRIIVWKLTTSPIPGMSIQGLYQSNELIESIAAGYDQAGRRRLYYTTQNGNGFDLKVLDATNLNAMNVLFSTPLANGVSKPIKYLPAFPLQGQPPRLVIGGTADKTQILAVAGAPSSLSVIPAGSSDIAQGAYPNLWLLDYPGVLRAYDISSPLAPVRKSELLMPESGYSIQMTDALGATAAIGTGGGKLVRVDTSNAASPFIMQIAEVADSEISGLAFDGADLHAASYFNGYEVIPVAMTAKPAEDPNFALSRSGKQQIAPICSGTTFTLRASFVAIPSVSSYRWMKWNEQQQVWQPLTDGAAPNGAAISGASTATLTITNPNASFAGRYACRASNNCGATTSSQIEARPGGYVNCDKSTAPPVLNINDFICFINRFAQEDDYANCDGSTAQPALNINDFVCFMNEFAASCN